MEHVEFQFVYNNCLLDKLLLKAVIIYSVAHIKFMGINVILKKRNISLCVFHHKTCSKIALIMS